jgi:hypothetical protein
MSSSNPNNLAQALPGAGGSFAVNGLREIQYESIDSTCLAPGAVTSAQVAPNLIQTISVTPSNSAITGMYAVPTLIIPAPASGSIVVLSAVLRYVYGVHAFTGGGTISLQYGNTVHGGGTTPLTTVAASVVLATSSSDTQLQQAAATTTLSRATGLYLSNATGAFALAGGSTSSVTIIVQYVVV